MPRGRKPIDRSSRGGAEAQPYRDVCRWAADFRYIRSQAGSLQPKYGVSRTTRPPRQGIPGAGTAMNCAADRADARCRPCLTKSAWLEASPANILAMALVI